MSKLNEDLIYEALSVVEEIPEGRVATYGQIAKLIGREKNSRLVGRILSRADYYGEYPCHRVVNHAGKTVDSWHEQRFWLEKEGIKFKKNGNVDWSKFKWVTKLLLKIYKYIDKSIKICYHIKCRRKRQCHIFSLFYDKRV